jgi:hypothetical protein
MKQEALYYLTSKYAIKLQKLKQQGIDTKTDTKANGTGERA